MLISFVLTLSMVLAHEPAPASVGEPAADLLQMSMPKDWIRSESKGLLSFTRLKTDESGFKMLTAMSARPKTGSLRHTFQELWQSVRNELAPGEPPSRHLVPLVMRNANGVTFAFDGDRLEKHPFGLMLYVVDCGDSVVPIVGIYGTDPPFAAVAFVSDPGPTELAKTISGTLDKISLKKGKSAAGPLFTASELAGTYHQTLVASSARYIDRGTGAYRGDASSGTSTDFVFGSDGAYKETSALVVRGGSGGVTNRKGTWKFAGDRVIIHYTDGKSPDKKLWLIGLGLNRRGDNSLAYLVDARYIDKYFFQMFIEGADVSYFYYQRTKS